MAGAHGNSWKYCIALGLSLISHGNTADISNHVYCLICCFTGMEDGHNTVHHYLDFMGTTRIIGDGEFLDVETHDATQVILV